MEKSRDISLIGKILRQREVYILWEGDAPGFYLETGWLVKDVRTWEVVVTFGKSPSEVQEGGNMHLLGGSGGGVGEEMDFIVAHVSVAGSGFAAHVGHDAGDD